MIMITVWVSMRCIITLQDTVLITLTSAVLRIRDVYAGFRVKKIPGIRIPPDPIKEFNCFLTKKLFIALGKMILDVFNPDPRCEFFPIPDADFFPSRMRIFSHPGCGFFPFPDPDFFHPGSRVQKSTGSRFRIRNTAKLHVIFTLCSYITE